MTFIAGPCTVTYDGSTLGISEDGIELEQSYFADLVRGDNAGDSVQDGVYRGGDCFLSLTLIEWDNAKLHLAMNPYGGAVDVPSGIMGQVGRLLSNLAKQIVITPVAGTTAAAPTVGAATPDTLTLAKCILAENFPVRYQFAARLRKVPLRFRVLPVNGIWFVYS